MAEQPFIHYIPVTSMHRQTSCPTKSNPKIIATGKEISSLKEPISCNTENLGLPDVIKITKLMLEFIVSRNAGNMTPKERRDFVSLVNGLLALTDDLR